MPRPYALLAELTYRCPLHCPYCSNPVSAQLSEIDTDAWRTAIAEAASLGVVQLHLSGGEPLLRSDLTELVAAGRRHDLYTSLVTSGVGLRERCADLAAAGLDHVQLSLQDSDEMSADRLAGARVRPHKIAAARAVTAHRLPLTINVVLHRHNIERIAQIADLAVDLGAERLELAHAQYYGWALVNRTYLLPDRDQLARAEDALARARERHGRIMDIQYVLADYLEAFPKPCMHGWGERHIVIAPDGRVFPCLSAAVIPSLPQEWVTKRSLVDIWEFSELFNEFRGLDWLPEPCRSCERKAVDRGGCRCQAYLLTGDAARTDPVCALAPDHQLVTASLAASPSAPRRRTNPRRVAPVIASATARSLS